MLTQNRDELLTSSISIRNSTIFITFIAISSVAFIIYFASRKITDPIKQVVKSLKYIAEGEGDLTKRLSEISQNLLLNSGDTSQRATNVASSSEEMSENLTNVAVAMEESATNINMVAAAAEEMNATINEITENAERVRGVSLGAVNQAHAASKDMAELENHQVYHE